MKDYCVDKFKAKASMPISNQDSGLSNKAKKDKKKKQYKTKQNFTIPTTRVNAAQTGKPYQKKKKNRKRLDRDLSMVTYFNYDKNGYYINTYPNQLKNQQ